MDKHWHAQHAESLTFGQKVADIFASGMGSWTFIITQSIILIVWVILNVIGPDRWDIYPFILLNLMLSLQAAYAAPIIMVSQNRQAERDRHQAEADYRTNIEAERRIEALQIAIAKIENEKIDWLIEVFKRHLEDTT